MEHTGSQYQGNMENGRFHGDEETFVFTDGTKYVGGFKNGMFHGEGTLHFPGGVYRATWKDGVEVDGDYIFKDGLKYNKKKWQYCTHKDRRFYTEHLHGIKQAGELQLTDQTPPHELGPGQYDSGDGNYQSASNQLFGYSSHQILREPDDAEAAWITSKCRVGAATKSKLSPPAK